MGIEFYNILNFTTASCGFSAIARLSCIGPNIIAPYISDHSNAEIALISTAVTQNHGDSRKSRHTTSKSRDGRKYVIILQREEMLQQLVTRLRPPTLVANFRSAHIQDGSRPPS